MQFSATRKEDNKALVERIRAYIYQSIFQNLTEEAVAAHFGISTGYLSRLFKEFSPGGFSAYLKECKLEAAAQLLREKKCKEYQRACAEAWLLLNYLFFAPIQKALWATAS